MKSKKNTEPLKKHLQSSKGIVSEKSFFKKTITFTIPMMAAALPMIPVALHGQCVGNDPAVTNNLGTVSIDVDGGGADFRFKLDGGNPVMSNINAAFKIGTRSGGAVMNAVGGQTILTGTFSGSPGPYMLTGGGGYGSLQAATGTALRLVDNFGAGNVPIVKGTIKGFITLSISGTMITIGEFGIDSDGGTVTAGDCASMGALPVELTHFQASSKDNNVNLHWQTATETNNAGFEIERSEDGKKFNSIAWMEGQGTSYENQKYVFEDENLRAGLTYYYRLKQVDFDGTFDYSKIVNIRLKNGREAVSDFYPNPVSSFLTTIEINSKENGQWTANIFDGAGRAIYNEQRFLEKGHTKWVLDLKNLSKGLYFVKFGNGKEQYYRKLIIE